MEKVKEIYIEAKKSRNFQTYSCGYTIDVSDCNGLEEIEVIRKKYQSLCRKATVEEINLDKI